MKNIARVLVGIGLLIGCAANCQTDAKAKVLFIGKKPDHPFGTHMYLHTCGMLAKCLALTDGVETVVVDTWPTDDATLKGVSTIVIYTNPAAELLLDSPHRDKLAALMKQGVGLVTIHWASSVRKANFDRLGPTWLSYMGGTWVSNVGLHTGKFPLKQLAPKHPISRGWSEYEIHDEYYLNPTITDQATPIVQVTAKDKPVIVGWAFERSGGGRSFGTTLGHYYRNFQHEPFRRMYRQRDPVDRQSRRPQVRREGEPEQRRSSLAAAAEQVMASSSELGISAGLGPMRSRERIM